MEYDVDKPDLTEFRDTVKFLNTCCLQHPGGLNPEEIERVIKWSGPSGDSTEYGLFQLKTKAFGVLVDSSDYTGHG